MRIYSLFVLFIIFVGCASKEVPKEEFKGLPFNPPAWSEPKALLDGNFSAIGVSKSNTNVIKSAIESRSMASEKLSDKIEKRVEKALLRAFDLLLGGGVTAQELESDVLFLSAKVANEAVMEFERDEIWFSPMGDMHQLYSIKRESLERILIDSVKNFAKSNRRYSGFEDEKRAKDMFERLLKEL